MRQTLLINTVFTTLILITVASAPILAYTPTPTPTAEGSQGEWPLQVNPLPETTCDLNLDICGSTGVYSNVWVTVVDLQSHADRSYFHFTGTGGGFCVPVELYPETVNGISVESCDDVWPPDCTTVSYETDPFLVVDTTGCATPTPTYTGTPTPCCNDWMYATCYVRDSITGSLISGAYIEGSALTDDTCTTGANGFCTLDLYVHDTQYFWVTVTADGYQEFTSSYLAQQYGITIEIDIIPLHDPTQTPTATETPTPTPTFDPCLESGIEITLPGRRFKPGDAFSVWTTICNSTHKTLVGYPVFVILDINQTYFFAPSFTTFDNYLFDYPKLPPGQTMIPVVPEFSWPSGIPASAGIRFHAALLTPDMRDLIGSIDTWEFAWE